MAMFWPRPDIRSVAQNYHVIAEILHLLIYFLLVVRSFLELTKKVGIKWHKIELASLYIITITALIPDSHTPQPLAKLVFHV